MKWIQDNYFAKKLTGSSLFVTQPITHLLQKSNAKKGKNMKSCKNNNTMISCEIITSVKYLPTIKNQMKGNKRHS